MEKELKARESRTKSQNLMANFLAKSKAGPSMPSARHKEVAKSTDFDRVFKPFALRRGVEMAPVNYFGTPRKSVEENSSVVSDGGTHLPQPPATVIWSPPVSLPGAVHISVSCFTLT